MLLQLVRPVLFDFLVPGGVGFILGASVNVGAHLGNMTSQADIYDMGLPLAGIVVGMGIPWKNNRFAKTAGWGFAVGSATASGWRMLLGGVIQ